MTGKHADVEIRGLGHFNPQVEVIVGATGDPEAGLIAENLKTDLHVGVIRMIRNANHVVIPAAKDDPTSTKSHPNPPAGVELGFNWILAHLFDRYVVDPCALKLGTLGNQQRCAKH